MSNVRFQGPGTTGTSSAISAPYSQHRQPALSRKEVLPAKKLNKDFKRYTQHTKTHVNYCPYRRRQNVKNSTAQLQTCAKNKMEHASGRFVHLQMRTACNILTVSEKCQNENRNFRDGKAVVRRRRAGCSVTNATKSCNSAVAPVGVLITLRFSQLQRESRHQCNVDFIVTYNEASIWKCFCLNVAREGDLMHTSNFACVSNKNMFPHAKKRSVTQGFQMSSTQFSLAMTLRHEPCNAVGLEWHRSFRHNAKRD